MKMILPISISLGVSITAVAQTPVATIFFRLLLLSAVFISGCNSSYKNLELVIPKPYSIQYPALEAIKPSSIWTAERGVLVSSVFASQPAIETKASPAGFVDIHKRRIWVVDAHADLKPLASASIEDVRARLLQYKINELAIEGEYSIQMVAELGKVRTPETLARCDPNFVKALREILDNPEGRNQFVNQVVIVRNLKYIARVDRALEIEADVNAGVIAGAGFKAGDDRTLTWKMPEGEAMVVAWLSDTVPLRPLPEDSLIEAERAKDEQIAELTAQIKTIDAEIKAIGGQLTKFCQRPNHDNLATVGVRPRLVEIVDNKLIFGATGLTTAPEGATGAQKDKWIAQTRARVKKLGDEMYACGEQLQDLRQRYIDTIEPLEPKCTGIITALHKCRDRWQNP